MAKIEWVPLAMARDQTIIMVASVLRGQGSTLGTTVVIILLKVDGEVLRLQAREVPHSRTWAPEDPLLQEEAQQVQHRRKEAPLLGKVLPGVTLRDHPIHT